MAWSKIPPTQPGCYWWRKHDEKEQLHAVVRIDRNNLIENRMVLVGSTAHLSSVTEWYSVPTSIGGEWWDMPIQEPFAKPQASATESRVSVLEQLWSSVMDDVLGERDTVALRDVIKQQIDMDPTKQENRLYLCDWWTMIPGWLVDKWPLLSEETRLAVHGVVVERLIRTSEEG